MAHAIDPNSGYADLRIGDIERPVDVYKTWAALDEIRAETEGRPGEFWERVKAFLVEEGFPTAASLSHYAANQFVRWHDGLVDALKKADSGEAMPASPGSTASPSSTNPPA